MPPDQIVGRLCKHPSHHEEDKTSELTNQGGHYMRPDIIRLLVDTNRKDLVVHEDRVNGGVAYTKTIDRVGLTVPLDEE